MEPTALRDYFNADLFALVPVDATRIVEVGCGNGAMAREYRKLNPTCNYVGIEIDPVYAEASRFYCDDVLVGNIESMSDDVFKTLFPSSCWIFGDVLEHLYDPWALLRRIRASIAPTACIVACLPNAQHWSVQARLNCGEFVYEDLGLVDRTHIRWFTRRTASRLFESTGFRVVEGGSVVLQERIVRPPSPACGGSRRRSARTWRLRPTTRLHSSGLCAQFPRSSEARVFN